MGLSDSEKFSMIHSAILIQITRVTDGQTDSIAVAYTRYSYAVAHKNHGMHLLFQQDVVVSDRDQSVVGSCGLLWTSRLQNIIKFNHHICHI